MKSCGTSAISPSSISLPALAHTFIIYWFVFSFIGRIFGAYFFGKYADKTNFFKVMRLVAICHILLSLLIASVCITGDSSYHNYNAFYLASFLYSVLIPVTLILPAIYLLGRSPESQHILISTSIIFATFLGKIFAYIYVHSIPEQHLQVWYLLPVLSTFISLGIYNHVEKRTFVPVNKIKTTKYLSAPIHKKLLALVIGAAGNAGITYYYSFLNPYLSDIVIVQNYGLIRGQLPFYAIFGLFLLPAAKICQNFGILKTLSISLTAIFILGISIPFMATSDFVYTLCQILFACFLANLAAPSLAILHQLFKNTKNQFDTVFWFSLGTSISMLCLGVGSRIGFSLHRPLAGLLIFAVIILMCLLGISTKSFSRKITCFEQNKSLDDKIKLNTRQSKALIKLRNSNLKYS